jgi:hypothetical protein
VGETGVKVGDGVMLGSGVDVRVGSAVGRGVSTTGRNGVGVKVLFGSTVTVGPSGVGGTWMGAAHPLNRNMIKTTDKGLLPLTGFMVDILDQ